MGILMCSGMTYYEYNNNTLFYIQYNYVSHSKGQHFDWTFIGFKSKKLLIIQ